MFLDTVYLDHFYRASLEKLAIQQGWIDQDYFGDVISRPPAGRNSLRKKTLLLLTLFKHVDSSHSDFDLSRLEAEGVIAPSSIMATDQDIELGGLEDKAWCQLAEEAAFQLMLRFKREVVRDHVRRRIDEYRGTPAEAERLCLKNYEQALTDFGKFLNRNPEMIYFASDLEALYGNLRYCAYLSGTKQHPFACRFGNDEQNQNIATCDPIDDAYYIAKTTLTDEILFLPEPESIEDVCRIRNSKEIRRFREVFSAWCDSLQEADAGIEARMRKDVSKANRELRRLTKWREFDRSPLNFFINSIGGHIPVLSNILTVVTMVARMYEYRVEGQHRWVMLGQK